MILLPGFGIENGQCELNYLNALAIGCGLSCIPIELDSTGHLLPAIFSPRFCSNQSFMGLPGGKRCHGFTNCFKHLRWIGMRIIIVKDIIIIRPPGISQQSQHLCLEVTQWHQHILFCMGKINFLLLWQSWSQIVPLQQS